MSELYLFCLKFEKLNPITIYQNLTQNDKLPLTRIRMNQLLLNLYDDEGNVMNFDFPNKSQYTFDDILKLDLNEKTYYVGKPLGQKFVFSNEYPFIADPFLVTEYDSLLEFSNWWDDEDIKPLFEQEGVESVGEYILEVFNKLAGEINGLLRPSEHKGGIVLKRLEEEVGL